jgi:hypothetical protein
MNAINSLFGIVEPETANSIAPTQGLLFAELERDKS